MGAGRRCLAIVSAVSAAAPRQSVVTLDVEGVLTPEIWIALATRYDIDELRRTTKDEPDYGKLMQFRIDVLGRHGIALRAIQEVIAELEPLDGARAFLDELRSQTQVVLLSDTFEQFITPLMVKLGSPTVFCHRLDVAESGMIRSFTPRIADQKREAVEAFQRLNFAVIAAGDSFNDLSMIDAADAGFLFRAPPAIAAARHDLAAYEDYDDLLGAIAAARAALGTTD
jgi:phosphoserine/homoserine phosphotransferase